MNWKNVTTDEKKRFVIISKLLEKHPHFIEFMLDTEKPELRASPEEIREQAGCFSSGEQVLVSLALDFWNGSGETRILKLNRLDQGNFRNAMEALRLWRHYL